MIGDGNRWCSLRSTTGYQLLCLRHGLGNASFISFFKKSNPFGGSCVPLPGHGGWSSDIAIQDGSSLCSVASTQTLVAGLVCFHEVIACTDHSEQSNERDA